MEKIAFDDVVSFQEIDGLFENILLSALDKEICAIGERRPLWRVNIYECSYDKKQYVTFCCHHTLFDGNSGAQFHQSLVVEKAYHAKDEALQYQETLFEYATDGNALPDIPASSEKLVDLFNPSALYTIWAIIQDKLLTKWVADAFL